MQAKGDCSIQPSGPPHTSACPAQPQVAVPHGGRVPYHLPKAQAAAADAQAPAGGRRSGECWAAGLWLQAQAWAASPQSCCEPTLPYYRSNTIETHNTHSCYHMLPQLHVLLARLWLPAFLNATHGRHPDCSQATPCSERLLPSIPPRLPVRCRLTSCAPPFPFLPSDHAAAVVRAQSLRHSGGNSGPGGPAVAVALPGGTGSLLPGPGGQGGGGCNTTPN